MEKSDVLKYLSETNSYYGTYHNHKETMAWAGLVLFIIFITKLISSLPNPNEITLLTKILLSILVIVLCCIVWKYMTTQLNLIKVAADTSTACFYLYAKISRKEQFEPNDFDFSVENCSDSQYQSSFCIPKTLLDKRNEIGHLGSGARKSLENAAYTLVVIAVFSALLKIWLPCRLFKDICAAG